MKSMLLLCLLLLPGCVIYHALPAPVDTEAKPAEVMSHEASVSFFAANSATPKAGELVWSRRVAAVLGGRTEVTFWEASRADIVTATHAVEMDWSYKWAESLGQAGWYAINTGLKPAVVLLVENMQDDQRYVLRCQAVAVRYGVELWVVDTNKSLLYQGDSIKSIP